MGRGFCAGACAWGDVGGCVGAGFAWLWESGGNRALESTVDDSRAKARWAMRKTFPPGVKRIPPEGELGNRSKEFWRGATLRNKSQN